MRVEERIQRIALRRLKGTGARVLAAISGALLKRNLQKAFYVMSIHSTKSIQNEALCAAESLAGLNEEFLTKADSVPLQVGMLRIVKLVESMEFKEKWVAIAKLSS